MNHIDFWLLQRATIVGSFSESSPFENARWGEVAEKGRMFSWKNSLKLETTTPMMTTRWLMIDYDSKEMKPPEVAEKGCNQDYKKELDESLWDDVPNTQISIFTKEFRQTQWVFWSILALVLGVMLSHYFQLCGFLDPSLGRSFITSHPKASLKSSIVPSGHVRKAKSLNKVPLELIKWSISWYFLVYYVDTGTPSIYHPSVKFWKKIGRPRHHCLHL